MPELIEQGKAVCKNDAFYPQHICAVSSCNLFVNCNGTKIKHIQPLAEGKIARSHWISLNLALECVFLGLAVVGY